MDGLHVLDLILVEHIILAFMYLALIQQVAVHVGVVSPSAA